MRMLLPFWKRSCLFGLTISCLQGNALGPANAAGQQVFALALAGRDKLVIGGTFTQYGGVPRSGLAMVHAGELPPSPPAILQQRLSQTNIQGETAALSADVVSYSTPSCQWQFQGQDLPGATNSLLELANVSPSQAGEYRLVVSNPQGRAVSDSVILTVQAASTLPGNVDLDFRPLPGPDGKLTALAVQADGKILVSGEFQNVNGIARPGLARLNADGSLDLDFVPSGPVTNLAQTLLVQTDGKILVGLRKQAGSVIYRLNPDGSADAGFDPSEGAGYGYLWSGLLALAPDGKLITAGVSPPMSEPMTQLLRLNVDGTADWSWASPLLGWGDFAYNWTGPQFDSIAVQVDGQVLAKGKILGGTIGNVFAFPAGKLHRFDENGRREDDFTQGAGGGGPPNAILVQSDNRMLLWGPFGIVRLEPDGPLDGSFHGPTNDISTAALEPDGKIIVAGSFDAIQRVPRHGLARLNSDGSLDPSFDAGSGAGELTEGYVPAIGLLAFDVHGRLVVGGQFTTINGVARQNLARILTGQIPGPPGIARQPTGGMAAEGTNFLLSVVASVPCSFQWQRNGTNLPGATFPLLRINEIGLGDAGDYSVILSNSLGETTSTVARIVVLPAQNLPGSLDLSFDAVPGADGTVNALLLQPDGKVLIAGQFYYVNGTARNQMARLNPDGTLDTGFDPPVAFGSSLPHSIAATLLQADGKILVAGQRETIGPNALLYGEGHYLARFTPSGEVDPSFHMLTYTNDMYQRSFINALGAQSDGKLLLSSTLEVAVLMGWLDLIRLNPDGTPDPGFPTPNHLPASSFAAQPDGKMLVGLFGGMVCLNADGSQDATFQFSPELGAAVVRSIAVQPDGQILITGTRTARLQPDGSLDKSFNPGAGSVGNRIVLQSDGRILVAGTRVIQLRPDGSLESAFPPVSVSGSVNDLQVQPDGRIVIGGAFSAVNDIPRNNVARIWARAPGESVPPSILTQPANQVVSESEDASFSVVIAGTPLPVVQWLFNGTPLPGATNCVLARTKVSLEDAGFYQAILSNAVGVVRSDAVSLGVKAVSGQPGGIPDLRIVNPEHDGSQFSVIVPFTETGKSYWLEFRDSLNDSQWQAIGSILGAGSCSLLSDSSASGLHRLYRVRAQ